MGSLSARHTVPLSISLPGLRKVHLMSAEQISKALREVHDFFYPVTAVLDAKTHSSRSRHEDKVTPDSGYVSEVEAEDCDDDDDDGENDDDDDDDVETPSIDPMERDFAIRWLTGLVGHAADLSLDDETTSDHLIDVACSLLSQLTRSEEGSHTQDPNEDDDPGMTRRFEFAVADDYAPGPGVKSITVALHDSPMQTGEDHTDVGLQTWGASVVMSRMICDAPEDFGFVKPASSSSRKNTRILELGAGTGLLSLVLSSLLSTPSSSSSSSSSSETKSAAQPTIIATDYHPTVLHNLEANASSHIQENKATAPIIVTDLDWSAPKHEAPLHIPADIIVAADVAYAPEHAIWLRDCAAALLARDGIFWLMVSVRPNGKFADISNSVDVAFAEEVKRRDHDHMRVNNEGEMENNEDDLVLKVLSVEFIEKRRGVGRADEVGYKMFKIGWGKKNRHRVRT